MHSRAAASVHRELEMDVRKRRLRVGRESIDVTDSSGLPGFLSGRFFFDSIVELSYEAVKTACHRDLRYDPTVRAEFQLASFSRVSIDRS